MTRWLVISLGVLLLLCSLLLWSSNSFDQTSKYSFPLKKIEQDSLQLDAMLPMTFAHADHAKQQCVACHHNFQDDTGQGLCLDCHRKDHKIAFKMKDHFHDLCMTCHVDKQNNGEVSGPLRECEACHTEDHRP